MFNFTYDASFFLVSFFVLVPAALVALSRRVQRWRKLLWVILATALSWLGLIAMWMLVARPVGVGDDRTPWQQRTWVVGVVLLVTLVSPAIGLLYDEHLEITEANAQAQTAYQSMSNNRFQRDLGLHIKKKHGWRYYWHWGFTNLALLTHEIVGLNPVVRLKFSDGSTAQLSIQTMGLNDLELTAQKGTDADGNIIHPPADVAKYLGDRGKCASP